MGKFQVPNDKRQMNSKQSIAKPLVWSFENVDIGTLFEICHLSFVYSTTCWRWKYEIANNKRQTDSKGKNIKFETQ
jgi:hypothetical protein